MGHILYLYVGSKIRRKMEKMKVETLVYYSKAFAKRDHIAADSKKDIQELLDRYASEGYRLASTNSAGFGYAIYIFLYFEKVGG